MPAHPLHRRTILRSGGAFLAAFAGCNGSHTVNPLSDGEQIPPGNDEAGTWPMFGFDPANTGYVADTDVPTDAGDGRWRFWTNRKILAPPVVARRTVYVGSYDGTLYAVDTDSGESRWQFETDTPEHGPGAIYTSPAVVDDVVYVGNRTGYLYALDAVDGTERWQVDLGEGGVTGAPAVVDDVVYVGEGTRVMALQDGEKLWTFERGRDTGGDPPAVANGLVYAGGFVERSNDSSDRAVVHALDARTGKLEWQFERSTRPGEDGNGKSRSNKDTNEKAWGTPAVANGIVYVGGGDGILYALDAATGEKQWDTSTHSMVDVSPVVTDRIVCVGGTDGSLTALDATTGEKRWTFETGKYVHTAPVIAGKTVVHGSLDMTVYAVDAETGEKQWTFDGDAGFGGPIIADGVVYIGSEEGALYALKA